MSYTRGMYNPEMAAMHSIDRNRERRVELSPLMERAYDRAREEVLTNPDFVIQEKDFTGVYDPQTIATDTAEANRLERLFASRMGPQDENTKKIADTFEAIVLMQSEMNEWLGSNASTLKTARYDDYKNKVDMIAEWTAPAEGSRLLALAVDVTFGMRSVEKKLTEIRHEIERGELGSIKYFRDEAGNIMGTRRNVARTVVGISQPVIEELAGLWLDNKNKTLGAHPIQRVMIDQIEFQLAGMQRYAEKLGQFKAAQAYQQAHAGILRVKAEKHGIAAGDLAKDPVRTEIAEQTRAQFG